MPTRERKPNRLLAWERLQRGWSHEELARQIIAEMERRGDKDTGLNRNTVRRWETGERRTDPRYRKYLVAVFGKPADQLPWWRAGRPAWTGRRFSGNSSSWGRVRSCYLSLI
ncbi:helix-turn-helix domain-containing protein [Carbonactinospora thermoautotrophica]|uniref:helix-turn-helix domain-containing protein n=1 Tax=Carbonactinospora thermoautotrophica TaxID=1469144 RepID=UPI003DAA0975